MPVVKRRADRSGHTHRAPPSLPPLRHGSTKRSAGARSPAALPILVERPSVCCPSSRYPQQPDSPTSSSSASPLPLTSSLRHPSLELPAPPCTHQGTARWCLPVPAAAPAARTAPGTPDRGARDEAALAALLQDGTSSALLGMLRREAARRLLASLRLRALRLAVVAGAAQQRTQAGSLLP